MSVVLSSFFACACLSFCMYGQPTDLPGALHGHSVLMCIHKAVCRALLGYLFAACGLVKSCLRTEPFWFRPRASVFSAVDDLLWAKAFGSGLLECVRHCAALQLSDIDESNDLRVCEHNHRGLQLFKHSQQAQHRGPVIVHGNMWHKYENHISRCVCWYTCVAHLC